MAPSPAPTTHPTPQATGGELAWVELGDMTDALGGRPPTSVVAAPGGGYVAFGQDRGAVVTLVWTSPDGVRWQAAPRSADVFGGLVPDGGATVPGDGMLVVGWDVSVAGGSQRAIWASSDGRVWAEDRDPIGHLRRPGA